MTARLATYLVTLMTLLWGAVAVSSTPAEDFIDDKLLSQGTREVDAMNAEQLDAFIEYVAICDASAEARDKELMCQVATTRFQIKNAAATALNRLVTSLDIHSRLVSRQWNTAAPAARATLGGYIERSVEIFRTLRKSAASRYAELTRAGGNKRGP